MILEVNLTGTDLLGVERGLLIGEPLARFVDKEDANTLYLHFRQVLETQSKQTCHIRLTKKDGSQTPVKLDSLVFGERIGSPESFRTAVTGVTNTKQVESERKDSQETFRLFYENAPLGHQSLDENGYFLEVNQAWLDMLGYSRKEVIGKWVGDFLAPEYLDRLKMNFPKFKSVGEIHGIEFVMLRKDGSRITVTVDGRVRYTEQGEFKQTHCILHDITEQKLTEDAKARSEKIYRQMFEGTHAVKILIDPESGQLIDANQAAADFYGYTVYDLKRLKISDINTLTPEQIFAEMALAKKMRRGHFFFKHRLASGQIRDVEVHSSPLDLGDKRILYSIIHDVTDRKKAEEEADLANQEWERTFNAISDFVIVLDDQHKILRANKAMADALGMAEQELIGKPCFELVHGEKEPPVFCPHSQLLTDGQEHSAEVVEPRLGGIYDVRVSPLLGQNEQIIGSVHVNRDITKRKTAEKIAQEHIRFQQILMDVIPIPVFFKDRDGKYLGCNEAFSKFLGRSKTEIIGKSVFELNPERLAEIYHGKDIELLGIGGVQTYESRIRFADGTEHDVIAYKSTFPDMAGTVGGLIGVILDITEQKQAVLALKESESKFRNLFNNAEVGMFRTRLDGSEILDMNEKYLKLFGRTREEMRGGPSAIHWADPQEREEMFRKINTDGRVTEFECKMLNKRGEVGNLCHLAKALS